MPYTIVIRMLGVVRNRGNGFPARLLDSVAFLKPGHPAGEAVEQGGCFAAAAEADSS